eukprot:30546-Chlamydomonas_euryale.AAC.3
MHACGHLALEPTAPTPSKPLPCLQATRPQCQVYARRKLAFRGTEGSAQKAWRNTEGIAQQHKRRGVPHKAWRSSLAKHRRHCAFPCPPLSSHSPTPSTDSKLS